MGTTATEGADTKRTNQVDKNVSSTTGNKGEEVPGPPVDETCNSRRVSSFLWQFATCIGVREDTTKKKKPGKRWCFVSVSAC